MTEKKQNKTKNEKWSKLQTTGFWVLIAGLTLFWSGVYFGTQATLASQAHEATVKAQAVEDYKQTLKDEQ